MNKRPSAKKWQANKTDFLPEMRRVLASSYPVQLFVVVNIFDKSVWYEIHTDFNVDVRHDFDEALAYFNEQVNQ